MSGPFRKLRLLAIPLVVILVILAVSGYRIMLRKSREAVLEANLDAMRHAVEFYSKDRQKPPQALQDLVTEGYVRELPVDPITNSSSSWQPVVGEFIANGKTYRGITDVKSGAAAVSSRGNSYSSW